MDLRGEVIHGEFNSADARVAGAMRLYNGDGQARVLGATERLVVTDVVIVAAAKMAVNVFSDNDADGAVDDGERILAGSVGDNGGIAMSFVTTPRYCKRGITPKVKSDTAGQVDVTLTGFILTN